MRIFSASLKAVLLFAVLWLGCEFGSWLCRKNIFFSGTESAAFSVPGAFECNVRCNSVAATEKPILKLLGQDKKTLLQLQTRTVSENGRKKIFVDIIYPGGILRGQGYTPGVADNPEGKIDLKIFYNGELTAKLRENCDFYISVFAEYETAKTDLFGISGIEISPEFSPSVEICRPGAWKKADALFTILKTLFFNLTVILLLSIIVFKILRINSAETVSPAIPAGVVSAILVFGIISILWSILDNQPPEIDLTDTVGKTKALNPEPKEQQLYILTLMSSAALLWVINFFYFGKKLRFSAVWKIFSGIAALAIILFCRKPEKFFSSGLTVLPEYKLVILTGVAAICFIWKEKKNFQKLWLIPFAVSIFYFLTMCKVYLFRNFDYFDAHHYSVFLHPFWMVQSGFSPFNLSTTYGAYAAFTAPFFFLFGLSSFSMDCFILLLIFTCGILFFCAMKTMIKSLFWRWTALAGIAGLFVWNGVPGVYPQYLPLRTFFPALLFFWVAVNIKDCLSIKNYIVGTILAVSAAFWNPDSGCVLLTAWCIFIAAATVLEPEKKNLLKLFLIPATGMLFTGVIYAIHFYFYGKFPEISRLFTIIFWFGKAGFLQLPMPWCGLWLIPAGIYFAALSRGIGAITRRKMSDRDKMLFFVTVTGCGLFGYYIGRSHIGNLFSVSYPAIILVASAAERLRGRGWLILRFAAVFLLFFVSLHGINSCRKLAAVSLDQKTFQVYFNQVCANVSKQLPPSKKLLYSGHLEAMIAVETGAKAPFSHSAMEEIFWKKDCLNYVKNTGNGYSPALWIINMNWVNRHAPAFMRDLLTEQVRKRLNRSVSPNAMLMFYL